MLIMSAVYVVLYEAEKVHSLITATTFCSCFKFSTCASFLSKKLCDDKNAADANKKHSANVRKLLLYLYLTIDNVANKSIENISSEKLRQRKMFRMFSETSVLMHVQKTNTKSESSKGRFWKIFILTSLIANFILILIKLSLKINIKQYIC